MADEFPKPDTNFLSGTAKAGPYRTVLPIVEEFAFLDWARKNRVPPDDPTYDTRGFWKNEIVTGRRSQFAGAHGPDTYKTPAHESFSNESIYATPNAPSWGADGTLRDKLGNVVFRDPPPPPPAPTPKIRYKMRGE
jgi:hypothetical protein